MINRNIIKLRELNTFLILKKARDELAIKYLANFNISSKQTHTPTRKRKKSPEHDK